MGGQKAKKEKQYLIHKGLLGHILGI